MRLPLPAPSAVVGTVLLVRDGLASVAQGVDDALALVPRAAELIARVEAVVDRTEQLLEATELTVESAAVVTARADEVVTVASTVSTKADRLVAGGTGLMETADHLLGQVTPLSRALVPSARRLADSISPREVDAAISLLDRLPTVLAHLDEDVLPMLQQLEAVGPDVHQILEIVDDLREILTGLPGAGLLKRFGERKEDEDPPA